MHELSICQALLEKVVEERAARGFNRVRRISLELGSFSCLEPDALRFAFDVISRDTFMEGAVLEIAQPAGHAVCQDCGAEANVESRIAQCPACGSTNLHVSGGDSMRFIEMEVA